MKQFEITASTLEKLDNLMMHYGTTGLICELVGMFEQRARMVADIQYGFGNADRDDNEDAASILAELRESYAPDTANEASERTWLLRTFCELIDEVACVVAQYRSQQRA